MDIKIATVNKNLEAIKGRLDEVYHNLYDVEYDQALRNYNQAKALYEEIVHLNHDKSDNQLFHSILINLKSIEANELLLEATYYLMASSVVKEEAFGTGQLKRI